MEELGVDAEEIRQHEGEMMTCDSLSQLPPIPKTFGEGEFDPLAGLSQYQMGKFQRMKEAVSEMQLTESERKWASDMCLLRYLRARDWKIAKSVPMFTKTIEWRREFDVENIEPEQLEIESETGKNYLAPIFDKFGRPVVVMSPGRQNTDTYDRQMQYTVFNMERAIRRMDESKGIEQMVLLFDLNGFSLSTRPPLSVSKQFLDILSNHYPERLGVAFIIDAPWLFSAFWKLIRPFVNKKTRDKIIFVSGNTDPKSKKYQAFAEYFDMSQMEKRFGGSSDFEYRHSEFWPALIEDYWRTAN